MCILDNKPAICIPNLEAGADWDYFDRPTSAPLVNCQRGVLVIQPDHHGTASKYH